MHPIEQIVPSLPGWSSIGKCMKLYSLVVTHKIQLSVEVGLYGAKCGISMAIGHKETGGMCFGIDPYTIEAAVEYEKEQANIDWWTNNSNLERVYRDTMIQLLAHDLTGQLNVLRMKSDLASTLFKNDSIGLVVIDANHNFEAVSKDFELWLPKIYEGGFLLADDLLWDGVSKAAPMIEHYGFKELEIVDDPAGSRWGLYQKISNKDTTFEKAVELETRNDISEK